MKYTVLILSLLIAKQGIACVNQSAGEIERFSKVEVNDENWPTYQRYTTLIHNRPDQLPQLSIVVEQDINNYSHFSITSGDQKAVSDVGHRVSLNMICKTKDNLIGGIYSGYHDGIGLPWKSGFIEQKNGEFLELSLPVLEDGRDDIPEEEYQKDRPSYQKCDVKYSSKSAKNVSELCECDFEDEIQLVDINSRLNELLPEYGRDLNNNFDQRLVVDEERRFELPLTLLPVSKKHYTELEKLIARAKAHKDIQFEELDLVAGIHVVNFFIDNLPVFTNFGYSLVYINNNATTSGWFLWYVQSESSKTIQNPRNLQISGAGRLVADICMFDCHWWGYDRTAEINFVDKIITVQPER